MQSNTNYQEELKRRVAEYLERYPYDHGTRDFPSADELYEELVRAIALDSFKNGKRAALARGQRKSASREVKGSALQHGKLRTKA